MEIEVKSYKGDRYAVYSIDGKLLDDAQGYGYKTKQKAHAAYAYKNRDRSKDNERKARQNAIKKWLKEHPKFSSSLEDVLFYAMKDGDDITPAKAVKLLLKDYPDVEFKPNEIAKVWDKM